MYGFNPFILGLSRYHPRALASYIIPADWYVAFLLGSVPFSMDVLQSYGQASRRRAKLRIKTRAHILRYPCDYKLASDGIDTRAL
jgi:hypothetical protein